ncbi:MAG: hypothetical protein EP317_05730 [Bacillota bacterium]|nr:MAG: hypothetical protein EP317_05730 [Bacillota bacterium]
MNCMKEFEDYIAKIGDRKSLYSLVARKFNATRALYPGSYIDISPSFVLPDVTYIDNFNGAIHFFNHMDEIKRYVEKHKVYSEECSIKFFGSDYTDYINIEQVDMIISQFAGFVGQATKRYLKKGGILLCNDSHGDATLAYLDDDYDFIGVVLSNNTIETNELDKYFKFARNRSIDLDKVKTEMKGPKYKFNPTNYIFMLR